MSAAEELLDRAGDRADSIMRDLAKAGQLRGASRRQLRAALVAAWTAGAEEGLGAGAPPEEELVDAASAGLAGLDAKTQAAIAALAHLGAGGAGPWENRQHRLLQFEPSYPAVDAWVNATYSVQMLQHELQHGPAYSGIDHLLVRRHDQGRQMPWRDLQAIKDRLAPGGQGRWAIECFPPRSALVDNANLRHIWVMPVTWSPPVDLRDVRT